MRVFPTGPGVTYFWGSITGLRSVKNDRPNRSVPERAELTDSGPGSVGATNPEMRSSAATSAARAGANREVPRAFTSSSGTPTMNPATKPMYSEARLPAASGQSTNTKTPGNSQSKRPSAPLAPWIGFISNQAWTPYPASTAKARMMRYLNRLGDRNHSSPRPNLIANERTLSLVMSQSRFRSHPTKPARANPAAGSRQRRDERATGINTMASTPT